MHESEVWQEYSETGERLTGAGRAAERGNPMLGDEDAYVSTASVWLYRRTEEGIEVLFQQRSKKVDRNAGKWDMSAGGHVNQGEATVDAAAREAFEEIGAKVEPEKLEFIFRLRTIHKVKMFINYFLYDWTGREDEFSFADGEVEQVKWVKLSEFDEFVDAGVKDPIRKAKFTRELTKFWLGRKEAEN